MARTSGNTLFAKALKRRSLTQQGAAEELTAVLRQWGQWLTAHEVSHLCCGRRRATLEQALAIREVFGIPIESWATKRVTRGRAA